MDGEAGCTNMGRDGVARDRQGIASNGGEGVGGGYATHVRN